jgi:hypothetical protein
LKDRCAKATQNIPDVCNIKFHVFIRTLFVPFVIPRVLERVKRTEGREHVRKRYLELLAGLVHRVCAAG